MTVDLPIDAPGRGPDPVPGRVRIDDLRKVYRTRRRTGLFRSEPVEIEALSGVSFEVGPGEIFGLLGPNGAGKTTLIKCLTTLLIPTGGSAWINGYRLTEEDDRVRSSLGCMLMGDRGLYWKLTGRENLVFFGALYYLSPARRRRRADELIERFGLQGIADRPVETYSSGQKMKLAFAKALVHDASVLILDEPTNTLDVPSALELRATVRELAAEGRTILYTTHIMSEAESLCDRVAIIDRGRLLALGTLEELTRSLQGEEIIRIEGSLDDRACAAAAALSGVTRTATSVRDGRLQLTVVTSEPRELLPRLISTLTGLGAILQRISPEVATLEDVFIAHTGRTLGEDTRRQR